MKWPTPRAAAALGIAAVCVLAGCSGDDNGSSASASTTVSATTGPVVGSSQQGEADREVASAISSLPQPPSVAGLDQALNAYGQCLGEQLVVTLRFRAERFAGVLDEISLPPNVSDQSLIERERTRCERAVGLDAIVATAQADSPLTDSQISDVVDEYRSCIEADLPALRDQIALTALATLDDVDRSYAELTRGVDADSLLIINECRDTAVFGPAVSFGPQSAG